jgi:hypothetical protein
LGKTISEIRRMDSAEMAEWMAFYRIEPFGEQREDVRAGIVASTIANFMQGGKKPKIFTPSDFMLFKQEKPQEESGVVEQVKAVFSQFKRG